MRNLLWICALLAPVACTRVDPAPVLPDWSGAWALSEKSFADSVANSTGRNPDGPPLTEKYLALRARNGAANGGHGPAETGVISNSARCVPDGMPGIMAAPFAFEFLISPGQVTIVSESNEVRRIYTDGRPQPADPDPTFLGSSIGRWEGDTLVVSTQAIKPEALLFVGLHVTGQTRVQERIHKISKTVMQIETTIADPAIVTRPWQTTRTYEKSKQGMVEYYCTENNRDFEAIPDLEPPPDA
jgi:hypothetical protein